MTAKDGLTIAGIALEQLGPLAGLLGTGTAAAVAIAKAIVLTLQVGADGKASPQAVLSQIEALHDSLKANDAAADAKAEEKFGSGR